MEFKKILSILLDQLTKIKSIDKKKFENSINATAFANLKKIRNIKGF
jgi:hypothetical protein